jgi:hypothetical protein
MKNGNGPDKEPDWANPSNDRKTPYTEEEIDTFVEDFIRGLDEQEWLSITAEYGEEKARKRIRTAFVKMDENNLVNMSPKGSVNYCIAGRVNDRIWTPPRLQAR